MKIKSLIAAGLIGLTAGPLVAQAQQSVNQQQQVLPPALQAAINSGNAAAIAQVIATLSGGNPERAAQLAGQTMAAAERLLATNPAAAVAIANAAMNVISANPTASMAQTSSAMSIAARIMVSPAVMQLAPQAAAQLATSTMAVAQNPVVQASLPTVSAAVTASVSTVSTNPSVVAAVPQVAQQLATAVQTVQQQQQQQVVQQQPLQQQTQTQNSPS